MRRRMLIKYLNTENFTKTAIRGHDEIEGNLL